MSSAPIGFSIENSKRFVFMFQVQAFGNLGDQKISRNHGWYISIYRLDHNACPSTSILVGTHVSLVDC